MSLSHASIKDKLNLNREISQSFSKNTEPLYFLVIQAKETAKDFFHLAEIVVIRGEISQSFLSLPMTSIVNML